MVWLGEIEIESINRRNEKNPPAKTVATEWDDLMTIQNFRLFLCFEGILVFFFLFEPEPLAFFPLAERELFVQRTSTLHLAACQDQLNDIGLPLFSVTSFVAHEEHAVGGDATVHSRHR